MRKISYLILVASLWLTISDQCLAQTAVPRSKPGQTNDSSAKKTYGNQGAIFTPRTDTSITKWHFENFPSVHNEHRDAGTVVIDFTVDQNGKIIEAHTNTKHTTISDTTLLRICEEAVKRTKLIASVPATSSQKGQIKFVFKINE